MAWAYEQQYLWAAQTLDPRDLNVNINELGREVNGFVDRDNIQTSAVTSAEVATGTFNALSTLSLAGTYASPATTFAAGNVWPWTNLGLSPTSFTTEDGVIVVDAYVAFGWQALVTAFCNDRCTFRLLIDGVPVNESGALHFTEKYGGIHFVGSAPVIKGSHSADIQMRAYSAAWSDATSLGRGSKKNRVKVNNQTYTSHALYIVKARAIVREQRR